MRIPAAALAVTVLLAGCAGVPSRDDASSSPAQRNPAESPDADAAVVKLVTHTAKRRDRTFQKAAPRNAPDRFRIVPDDYHVPWAGTAEDGRRFFLSDELYSDEPGRSQSWVGLYLWKADGSFDEVRVTPIGSETADPTAAGYEAAIAALLKQLGDYTLEPIRVEPFTVDAAGVTFGWFAETYAGELSIIVLPGDFIAYYEPWDGVEYDT